METVGCVHTCILSLITLVVAGPTHTPALVSNEVRHTVKQYSIGSIVSVIRA